MPQLRYIPLLLLLVANTSTADNIKVMTFNLRYASANDGANNWENPSQTPQRRQVVITTITNNDPDLIGLQEGEAHQLDYIASQLPADYHIERQRPSGGSGNEYAAFAYKTSKLQLLDRGVFSLGPSPGGGYWNNTPGTPFDPNHIYPENQFAFPRIALWGKFRWIATQQELLLYTTHFDLYNPTFNGESQTKSAHLITDDLLARNDRMPASPLTIILGDFNSSQNDKPWKHFTGTYTTNGITGDLTDTWLDTHGNFTDSGTFHGFNGGTISSFSRIDWILHRGGFTTLQTDLINTSSTATGCPTCPRQQYPSDHYPIITTLSFPAPRPDYDQDGLPDTLELTSPLSLPADPDTDNDSLLDGQEDLNGNGQLDAGETNPSNPSDTQKPTDIRHYQMDGILDHQATLTTQNGLKLYTRFDGRYLYLATQDAGEGNDHFIFLSPNPTNPVPAPFAKTGQTSQWDFFLADENDNHFSGWFDASKNLITNIFAARSATYFENGGHLEGVIDLAPLYGPGFTNPFHLAAAPYATADAGALITNAQVPPGNNDPHILGTSEYHPIHPPDLDHDGISDPADPDRDGDTLPDTWETAHNLNPNDPTGNNGPTGDPDQDHHNNNQELTANTSPNNPNSTLKIHTIQHHTNNITLQWQAIHGTTYKTWRTQNSLSNNPLWIPIQTTTNTTTFPHTTHTLTTPITTPTATYRLQILP